MEHPNPERRWQNMRRMAWLSILSATLYPIFVIIVFAIFSENIREDATGLLVALAAYVYTLWVAVIGAYMGFSSITDGWGKK